MLRIVLLGALAACGGGASATRPVAPLAPRAIAIARPAERLTPELVFSRIRTQYLGALERCYATVLKQRRASGRVTVLLTIDDTGRPSALSARGVTRRVERCFEQAMTRWTFPPATGTPAEQSFQLSFLLQPT